MTLDLTAAHAAVDALQQQHLGIVDTVRAENQAALDQATADLSAAQAALSAAQGDLLAAQTRPGWDKTTAEMATMYAVADRWGLPVSLVKTWNPEIDPLAMPLGTGVYLIDRATMPGATPAPEPTPAPLPEPTPVTTTEFGWDISSLQADANVSEAEKISTHRSLLGPVRNMRVFFGGKLGSWTTARLAACQSGDGVLISYRDPMTLDEIRAWLRGMPAKFRVYAGQVKICFRHEWEADWRDGGKTAAALKVYLDEHAKWNTVLKEGIVPTMTPDHIVKILLWYSQVIDAGTKGTWRDLWGGQDFGVMGMDCYNYQVWANQQDRYATPEELFGLLCNTIASETRRPVAVPEWGGTLAATDDTGTRRAAAITEQGQYLQAHGVQFAAWWCAWGEPGRNHHLDWNGPTSPEVTAWKALVASSGSPAAAPPPSGNPTPPATAQPC